MTEEEIELSSRRCVKLGYGAPVVTEDESNALALSIPGWRREFHEGVEKLKREFHFVEFTDAFAFTYKLATLAEREDHHPLLMTEWGKVTVYWWSHKINGLHVNDFIMAAKTDLISKLREKS
jgi:4a-hydroxytetrahydrobiopterin dehydratase